MKQKIYQLVVQGSHGSKINRYFDYSILILITLNVIAIILESFSNIENTFKLELRIFDVFSVVVFSIEYLMRIYVSDLIYPSNSRIKSAFKFIFSPLGLIDLFAILPFYIPFIIKVDLRFIRIFRLFRFFRILKVNRYTNALNLIQQVFKEKKSELSITVFATILLLILASILMYYIEGPIQPEAFPNVFATIWWAFATLTTIGYGDVYPITALGKVLSGIVGLMGIGLVALPTGIISAGFLKKIQEQKKSTIDKKCPHCGKIIK